MRDLEGHSSGGNWSGLVFEAVDGALHFLAWLLFEVQFKFGLGLFRVGDGSCI